MKEVVSVTREIHPGVLTEIKFETAIALLEVARDLRSGMIREQLFNMNYYSIVLLFDDNTCGTVHCIAGWVSCRLDKSVADLFGSRDMSEMTIRLGRLFSTRSLGTYSQSEAADAIENYIFNYSINPWNDQIPKTY